MVEQDVDISDLAIVADDITIEGRGSVRIGDYSKIGKGVVFSLGSSIGRITVGARCNIKPYTVLRCYDGSISIGTRTSIGEFCLIAGHGGVEIAENVIIASHCAINAAGHIFSSDIPVRFQGESAIGIEIEPAAWIGAHCTILDGVRIGRECIVGAGSVVTKSTTPNSIYFGSPAKLYLNRTEANDDRICER